MLFCELCSLIDKPLYYVKNEDNNIEFIDNNKAIKYCSYSVVSIHLRSDGLFCICIKKE